MEQNINMDHFDEVLTDRNRDRGNYLSDEDQSFIAAYGQTKDADVDPFFDIQDDISLDDCY